MCTVTYLPQTNNGFILTSNRDEDISRPIALPVSQYLINGVQVYYPKDPAADGTWIAAGSNGFSVCLYNGAFKPHRPTGNYRKSRGLVLLDFFNYKDQYDFISQYDFTGIEPFSLIFVKQQSGTKGLCELKWNGSEAHHINHDASLPHIWSSVTLYSPEVINQRNDWFSDWIGKHETFTKDAVLMFHHFGGSGDKENDIVMNRTKKKTVSICCINKPNDVETEIVYEDVLNKVLYSTKIITH